MKYISLLITYVVFTQIYPYIHLHDHHHGEDHEVCISVHPIDHHEEDPNHHDEHQEEDHHFVVDMQYVASANVVIFVDFEQVIEFDSVDLEAVPSEFVYHLDIPPKIPIYYITQSIPSRASPNLI